jgi:hypothetical protein
VSHWIKMETTTPEKPEILAIAKILDMDPEIVFTKCFKVWRWADSQTADGQIPRVDPAALDALVHAPLFADALRQVGWLQARDGALVIPNFARHMGQSAKQRALAARRSKRYRVTQTVTRASRSRNAPSSLISSSLPSSPKEKKPPPQRKRAGPARAPAPTLAQVQEYCALRRAEGAPGIDPERFWNYYEANGWVQGNSKKKIKNWKAAVVTWERNAREGDLFEARAPLTPEEAGRQSALNVARALGKA